MTELKFFGFSTFLITTDGGPTILIDPYIDENPTAPMKCGESAEN